MLLGAGHNSLLPAEGEQWCPWAADTCRHPVLVAPGPLTCWCATHHFGSRPAPQPAKSVVIAKFFSPALHWFNLANPLKIKTSHEPVKVSDYVYRLLGLWVISECPCALFIMQLKCFDRVGKSGDSSSSALLMIQEKSQELLHWVEICRSAHADLPIHTHRSISYIEICNFLLP